MGSAPGVPLRPRQHQLHRAGSSSSAAPGGQPERDDGLRDHDRDRGRRHLQGQPARTEYLARSATGSRLGWQLAAPSTSPTSTPTSATARRAAWWFEHKDARSRLTGWPVRERWRRPDHRLWAASACCHPELHPAQRQLLHPRCGRASFYTLTWAKIGDPAATRVVPSLCATTARAGTGSSTRRRSPKAGDYWGKHAALRQRVQWRARLHCNFHLGIGLPTRSGAWSSVGSLGVNSALNEMTAAKHQGLGRSTCSHARAVEALRSGALAKRCPTRTICLGGVDIINSAYCGVTAVGNRTAHQAPMVGSTIGAGSADDPCNNQATRRTPLDG